MNEGTENKEIKHSPLFWAVYNELLQHIGRDNAIQADELAYKCGITKRCLRHYISEIRTSHDIEKVVLSADNGYFIASARDEFRKGNRRLYSMAFSLLKAARANEKKAAMDGQGVVDDTIIEDFTRFLEAYGQED